MYNRSGAAGSRAATEDEERMEEIVRFEHVTMQFPGVLAVDDVSLSVRRGEVFALVGENGAGKSTLMNLLYGLQKPTLGEIYIKNQPAGPAHDPLRAMAMGVGMVHQHFKLVPSFTVAQNIALGREPRRGSLYDLKKAREDAKALSERFGLPLDPDDVVSELSVGLQQRVEILKALGRGADVLVLDEPTAVLTPQETDELFEVIRRIVKEKSMTVLLITHKLNEVMALSDRVGVMRRGRLLDVVETSQTSERALAALMVGRDVIFDEIRDHRPRGKEMLVVRGLTARDDRGLPALKGVDLTVHAGEILGVCGVEGNGQSELTECIMGMRPQTGGTVTLDGRDISRMIPRDIRRMGVSYIPEDRLRTGLSAQATVAENLLLGKQRRPEFTRFGVHFRSRAVRRYAEQLSQEFDVRASGVDAQVSELSGGNMQKIILAREFTFDSPVLVISQPTRGVDIGAIEFIHEKIMEKRNAGCAILLVSADLEELFRLSDRLVTLYEGQITGRFDIGGISMQDIGWYMTGGRQEAAQ
ncbi:MAG: ABC transporter ATP-binding protein [Eubacteriales bacterium]|nr:ABC transporter ATP-binding protein [Eubacteriales bacterium]